MRNPLLSMAVFFVSAFVHPALAIGTDRNPFDFIKSYGAEIRKFCTENGLPEKLLDPIEKPGFVRLFVEQIDPRGVFIAESEIAEFSASVTDVSTLVESLQKLTDLADMRRRSTVDGASSRIPDPTTIAKAASEIKAISERAKTTTDLNARLRFVEPINLLIDNWINHHIKTDDPRNGFFIPRIERSTFYRAVSAMNGNVISIVDHSPLRAGSIELQFEAGSVGLKVSSLGSLRMDCPISHCEEVIAIGRQSTVGMDPAIAKRLLRGRTGSQAELLVLEVSSGQTRSLSIARTSTPIAITSETIKVTVSDQQFTAGYVRLLHLSTESALAPPKLADILTAFKANDVDCVILDLRSSSSLNVHQGAEVCSLFMNQAKLSYTNLNQSVAIDEVGSGPIRWAGPLVILVDGNTELVSEQMAEELMLNNRALVIGVPTAGRDMLMGCHSFSRLTQFESSAICVPVARLTRKSTQTTHALVPLLNVDQPSEAAKDQFLALSAADFRAAFQSANPRERETNLVISIARQFSLLSPLERKTVLKMLLAAPPG